MYQHKIVTPEQALRAVKSGDRVVTGHACGEPQALVEALVDRAGELQNVEIVHMVAMGPAKYAQPGMENSFRHNALFVGAFTRKAVEEKRADYTPCFFSEIPRLFRERLLPVDVALIQVTPPVGTRKLYEFIDNNPNVELHPVEYVNDPYVIGRHDSMISINSALQVDLMGQVNAEMIGNRQFSGIGGQVDFVRGTSRSRNGKSVIALPSTAAGGAISRIVCELDRGAAVSTSRNDVHYIVTEYGVANLRGKSLRQRAQALIGIAHPDFREKLTADARAKGLW